MHGKIKNSHFIKLSVFMDCMSNIDNIEIRKVQALTGERSFTLVFPKQFATELGIERGNYLKCHLDEDRLIVEKVNSLGSPKIESRDGEIGKIKKKEKALDEAGGISTTNASQNMQPSSLSKEQTKENDYD
jgi:bifunctional DNA-binding transcriptional regulator/antitoxin component of YhaV-PrlF toxin-antitoxin module